MPSKFTMMELRNPTLCASGLRDSTAWIRTIWTTYKFNSFSENVKLSHSSDRQEQNVRLESWRVYIYPLLRDFQLDSIGKGSLVLVCLHTLWEFVNIMTTVSVNGCCEKLWNAINMRFGWTDIHKNHFGILAIKCFGHKIIELSMSPQLVMKHLHSNCPSQQTNQYHPWWTWATGKNTIF